MLQKNNISEIHGDIVNLDNKKNIVELLEEKAKQNPEKIILIEKEKRLTIGELYQYARIGAHILTSKYGVCFQDKVAFLLDRSIDSIILTYSILFAGAIYTPLSKEYPTEKLNQMIENLHSNVVISDLENDYWIKSEDIIKEIKYFTDLKSSLKFPVKIQDEDTIYIIHTSGTTGLPKAAPNNCRAVKNMMLNLERYLINDKPILHKTPLSFGVSMTEIFGFIIHSSPLIILNEGEEKNIDVIVQSILNNNVVYVNFVPSFIDSFSNAFYDRLIKEQRHHELVIMCAGEPLTEQKLISFNKTLGISGSRLINLYGSSETAVYFTSNESVIENSVTVGKPFSNTWIIIVDDDNYPLPLNTVGKILVKGDSVFSGYLNFENHYSSKFININNEKYFETGDIGKIDFNKELNLLGRKDNQVQVLGVRIELEAIEEVALSIPFIKTSIAYTKGMDENKKIFMAIEVNEEEHTKKEIENYFVEKLPEYMRPTAYYLMSDVFRLPSGKIDRKAIQSSTELEEMNDASETIEEWSKTEEKIIDIISYVLNRDKHIIKLRDSFFALGGNSILLLRLINIIEDELGVELTISDIFNGDTIEEISENVDKKINQADNNSKVKTFKHALKKKSYSMSDIQERMFISQEIKEDTSYNVTMAFSIDGNLNPDKLKSVLNLLVIKHPILTTAFILNEDGYMQIPYATSSMDVEIKNVSEEEVSVTDLINNFTRPFDLSKGEVIRSGIYKIRENRWLFILDLHHIVTDAISNQILINEISHNYNRPLNIDDRTEREQYQYIDFSEKRLTEEFDTFWNGYLSKIDLDKIDIHNNNSNFKVQRIKKRITINSSIQKTLSSKNVTLFSYFASCYACCLRQITDNNQVIFGMPINQRRFSELDNTMGMFSDSIPFFVDIQNNFEFEKILNNTSNLTLNLLDKSTKGTFDFVRSMLQTKSNNLNLYSNFFVFNDTFEEEKFILEDTVSHIIPVENNTGKFDMTMLVNKVDTDFDIELEYNSEKYNASFITSFFEMFIGLLNEAGENKNSLKNFYSLLKFKKWIKRNYIHQGKKIENEYSNVLDRLDYIVRLYPQNIAIRYGNDEITYKQLDDITSKAAYELLKRYDVNERNVAVHLDRSINQILAIISVLKAGGAYVPINEEFPDIKIQKILDETNPVLLLCEENSLKKFNISGSKSTFPKILSACHNENSYFKKYNSDGSSIAYIMFTSGTTGQPKGVEISHGNLLNLNLYFVDNLKVKDTDTVLQYANIGFDGSVWEIFMGLLNGATLQLINKDDRLVPERVNEIIKLNKVTIAAIPSHVVPSYDLSSLRILINGGTIINYKYLKKYFGSMRIINSYGPTECTVAATHYEVQPDNKRVIPIGIPNPNIEIFIKNGDKYCDVGEVGEILIGGLSTSKGYLEHNSLNQGKFIIDEILDTKFYKSGDLGSWDSSGNLIFHGREDDQVKINGYRFELDEIQNFLLEKDNIDDVVVIYDKRKHQRLFAFIKGNLINEENLKNEMLLNFPSYMIPNRFIFIESIPLTPNGKPDKNKLISIAEVQNESLNYNKDYSFNDSTCYAIIENYLGFKFDINKSFTENGGNSLMAMSVISELKKNDFVVSVKDLLKSKDLKNFMTNSISKRETIKVKNKNLGSYETVGTPIMTEFLQKNLPDASKFCQMVLVDISQITFDILTDAIKYLVKKHDSLRISITKENKFRVNEPSNVNYYLKEEVYEEGLSQNIVNGISQKLISNIDLRKNNLMAFEFIKTESRNYAFICMHHLLVDVVSWGIILRDLDEYLYTKKEDLDSPHFGKIADSVNRLSLNGQELSYWENIVAINKSNQYNKESFSSHVRKNYVDLTFSKTGFKELEKVGRFEEVLISAVSRSYGTILNKSKIQIMLEGHGRIYEKAPEDITDVVGWFTSEYPINLDIKEDMINQIDEVSEKLSTVPNHGVTYKLLRNQLSRKANPDLSFNYLSESYKRDSWNFIKETPFYIRNMISDSNYQSSIFMILIEKNGEKLEINVISDFEKYSKDFVDNFLILFSEEIRKFCK